MSWHSWVLCLAGRLQDKPSRCGTSRAETTKFGLQQARNPPTLRASEKSDTFSGRGEIPHRRCWHTVPQPASALPAQSGGGQQIRCESEADGTTTVFCGSCESPDKREREFQQCIVRCARHALILVTTGDCHESATNRTANRR